MFQQKSRFQSNLDYIFCCRAFLHSSEIMSVLSNLAERTRTVDSQDFLAYVCFMSAGLVVSNVWSLCRDLKDMAADDDYLKAKSLNDFAFRMIVANTDDPTKRQKFTCNTCRKSYSWMCSLRRHQLQCGNKEARNKCEFCAKKFYRRDRYKEHLLTHL